MAYFLSLSQWKSVVVVSCLALACGCKSAPPPAAEPPPPQGSTLTEIPDEVSLKQDRSALSNERKDIPEDIKRSNDELSFIRGLMGQADEEPAKIRERFNKALRDRRTKFDKLMKERRDDFTKEEKRARDEFLGWLKADRNRFVKRNPKANSDRRKTFFDGQETRRADFFANERDRRRDFESRSMEERKTFEDYVRERTNEFNQELRAYTATYYDRKKNLDLKKKADEKARRSSGAKAATTKAPTPGEPVDPDLEAFQNIPKTPAQPLGSQ
jgi:hypothetical protein